MQPKGRPLSPENSPHTSQLPLSLLGESGTRNETALRWLPLRVVLCPQNFSLDWCKQPDVGLPKPDLVVFLQLQLAEAAARGEFGRERYESGPFQQRALQRFQQLLADPSLPWKVSAAWALELVQEGPLPGQGRGVGAALRPLTRAWAQQGTSQTLSMVPALGSAGLGPPLSS